MPLLIKVEGDGAVGELVTGLWWWRRCRCQTMRFLPSLGIIKCHIKSILASVKLMDIVALLWYYMIKNGMIPGERNGDSLQHSCLGNPTDRGVWRAMGWQRDATWWLNNNNNYVYIQKVWKTMPQTSNNSLLTRISSGSKGWGILYLLTVDIFSFKFSPTGWVSLVTF